ncbi:MAG TPA: hypothetical protein VLX28_04665 [Thermoanaerobaculia bacterium]|nr:hypothetical protein [Thermoanaerobaculia bacterium]
MTAPLLSLRRLTLLVLAVVLCSLALVPTVNACCTEGSTQIVVSIICCTDPPQNSDRTALHQTCHNCAWQTTSKTCQRATNCAF